MDTWTLPPELTALIMAWGALLDARYAGRFLPLLIGCLFARGRRTVASWLRAAGIGDDFRLYYYLVGALGRKTELLAAILLRLLRRRLRPTDRWLFALDDSPTQRYGPCVEGAGIHHNPTPGPTDQKFLYGHIWVTLAWVLDHPWWGPIGLPLLAYLYIRQADLGKLPPQRQWTFQTKLELAADLIAWLGEWLRPEGQPVWLAADGFYSKRAVLRACAEQQFVFFGRLRKDASLWSLPLQPQGRRGPGQPPKYGKQAISLAKRAGQQRGWETIEVVQYRQRVTKTIKTFLATWHPAGGVIRVVLVKEEHGWLPFFCTQADMPAATILEVMSRRTVIEEVFRDIKEVEGAGQQQVRYVWANVGAYHLCLWSYALVEWWAWHRPQEEISDRSVSPWDDASRRPSHADRRKALQRQSIEEEYRQGGLGGASPPGILQLLRRLLRLVA
jgi:hypothetical protein